MLENITQLYSFNYIMWIELALLLGVLDLVVGANFFLIWLAVCSTVVAIITYLFPQASLTIQMIIFVFSSALTFGLWIYYLKTHKPKNKANTLNRRSEQLVGRRSVLMSPISNGISKIKLDDSIWSVKLADSSKYLPAGSNVIVVAADGLILLVKEIAD